MAQASKKVPIHVALAGTLQMIRTDFTNLPNVKRVQLANETEVHCREGGGLVGGIITPPS